jgi:hypothetical protein
MNRRLAPTALLLSFAALPMTWIACGGKTPPPENPSDESSSASPSGSGGDTTASSADIPAGNTDTSSSSSSGSSDSSSASAAPAAPAAPPAPAMSDTDCGKCVDKTCAKQATACGKDASCKSMLDGFHSCTGALQSCLDGATPPTDAKPKKLGAAFAKCAETAGKKTCKAKCQ